MAVTVIRPGMSPRPPYANDKEGDFIGAHYTNNPSCQDAAMQETYVSILTGDYRLICTRCGDVVMDFND